LFKFVNGERDDAYLDLSQKAKRAKERRRSKRLGILEWKEFVPATTIARAAILAFSVTASVLD
jgi:hypothetical protein